MFSVWCLVLFVVTPSLWAGQQYEIKTFFEFQTSAQNLIQNYQPEEVLVVFDLDNTLLTMSEDLGSDQWWNWQSSLMKKNISDADKLASGLVSTEFSTLLSIQGFLFASLPMIKVENTQLEVLKGAQARGIATIVLTSRGPDFQAATFRELYKHGFDFRSTALPNTHQDYLPREPFTVSELKTRYGFTDEEINSFGLSSVREILYQDGVYLTSGQHKGALLRVLLKDSGFNPKLILFVDDHKKNTDAVWEAYLNSNVEVFTYRYGFLDGVVAAFHAQSKKAVIHRWEELKPFYEYFR